MNHEEMFLKLMIRRYLMRRPNGVYRSMMVHSFDRVPRAVLDQVLDGCISEGAITVSEGERGAVRLAWNDAVVVAKE